MNNEAAQKLLDMAQGVLQDDFDSLVKRLEPRHPGGLIPVFVARVLEWQADPEKKQLVYEMFRKAFSYEYLTFFGSLNSFVGNCLLDDSYFQIEWRKPELKDFQLQWLPGGDFKTELTTKEDPNGHPEVIWSKDDNGTQKVELLLEAMDILEERTAQRQKEMEEAAAFIRSAFEKLTKP